MPFTIHPYRRVPMPCTVAFNASPFLKLPLAFLLGFWLTDHSCSRVVNQCMRGGC